MPQILPGDDNGYSDVFVYDVANDALEFVSIGNNDELTGFDVGYSSLNYDGNFVVFDAHLDGVDGVYLRDRSNGTNELIHSSEWHLGSIIYSKSSITLKKEKALSVMEKELKLIMKQTPRNVC